MLERLQKRIADSVSQTDTASFDTLVLDPVPSVSLLCDAAHPSFVELPVFAGKQPEY